MTSLAHCMLALLAGFAASCSPEPDLVVYCSLDQEFAEPMIRRYEQETGRHVRAEFDVEANKTVGLVRRIREESAHPRCDVFWSSEAGHSVQLGIDGFLQPYASPSAAEIPAEFRDPENRWTGFAARARVLIVNTDLCDPAQVTSMWDLVDPKWNGKVAMAKPVAGTTLTHMAALYSVLGEEQAEKYAQTISALGKRGAINIANGNSTVARLVGDGVMTFGWTDSDDCAVALERGAHVVAVYPDAHGCGTLLMPNTVQLVRGAPHPVAAKEFVDWVLRPETEKELAFSRSAQIPVRAGVARPKTVAATGAFRAMDVDYRAVGAELEKRSEHLKQLFVD
jgi:iron(III) transport system substrate-binding protein